MLYHGIYAVVKQVISLATEGVKSEEDLATRRLELRGRNPARDDISFILSFIIHSSSFIDYGFSFILPPEILHFG